jgi:hypothetical protein
MKKKNIQKMTKIKKAAKNKDIFLNLKCTKNVNKKSSDNIFFNDEDNNFISKFIEPSSTENITCCSSYDNIDNKSEININYFKNDQNTKDSDNTNFFLRRNNLSKSSFLENNLSLNENQEEKEESSRKNGTNIKDEKNIFKINRRNNKDEKKNDKKDNKKYQKKSKKSDSKKDDKNSKSIKKDYNNNNYLNISSNNKIFKTTKDEINNINNNNNNNYNSSIIFGNNSNKNINGNYCPIKNTMSEEKYFSQESIQGSNKNRKNPFNYYNNKFNSDIMNFNKKIKSINKRKLLKSIKENSNDSFTDSNSKNNSITKINSNSITNTNSNGNIKSNSNIKSNNKKNKCSSLDNKDNNYINELHNFPEKIYIEEKFQNQEKLIQNIQKIIEENNKKLTDKIKILIKVLKEREKKKRIEDKSKKNKKSKNIDNYNNYGYNNYNKNNSDKNNNDIIINNHKNNKEQLILKEKITSQIRSLDLKGKNELIELIKKHQKIKLENNKVEFDLNKMSNKLIDEISIFLENHLKDRKLIIENNYNNSINNHSIIDKQYTIPNVFFHSLSASLSDDESSCLCKNNYNIFCF